MDGRDHRVERVKHKRDACREELTAFAHGHLRSERLIEFAVDLGKVHARFLKQRAAFNNSRATASHALALPQVFAKSRTAVEALKRDTYIVLKRCEKISRSFPQRLLLAHLFVTSSPKL
jgi:hypothetical protein